MVRDGGGSSQGASLRGTDGAGAGSAGGASMADGAAETVAPRRQGRRRGVLKGAGIGAGLALSGQVLAAPRSKQSSRVAKPIVWRCQMAWTLKDDFNAYLQALAETLRVMTDGHLTLEILPAGAVVPTAALVEAVASGKLDCAQRVLGLDAQRFPAIGLWGSGPAFGMDAPMLLSWHQHGGGEALLAEIYQSAGLSVRSFLYGPLPTLAFGWFKRPLSRVEDLNGLRFHVGGLAAQMYQEMGATVFQLPVDEIVPALRRGEIDAAEFSGISADRALGLPDVLKVCMLQSFHQVTEQVELLINAERFDALSPDLQQKVRLATSAVTADAYGLQANRNSTHYIEMRELQGVRFYKTPETLLRAQLAAWDRVTARLGSNDPMFARVLDSMRRYAQRCVGWQNDARADSRTAYNHYFAQRAPGGAV